MAAFPAGDEQFETRGYTAGVKTEPPSSLPARAALVKQIAWLGEQRPVLITGSQRSGTTWVGHVLATSPRLASIHEPFNHLHREPRQVVAAPTTEQFHRVDGADEADWVRYLVHRVRLARRQAGGPWARLDPRRWLRPRRPLFKDPIALLSAAWMIERFQCPTIVMLRHPAGYVSSMLRMEWRINVPALAVATRGLAPELDDLQPELDARIGEPALPLLDEACLAWRVFARISQSLARRFPAQVRLLRNEDLSRDPLAEFERLHEHANVPWTSAARDLVRSLTASLNPTDAGDRVHQMARNSEANIWVWRERLSAAQIDRIRTLTADTSPTLYDEVAWEG